MIAISRRANAGKTSRNCRRRPTIEWLETRQLLTTFVVSNTNDGGPGSLRRGITNAQSGDVIDFDIPTTDPGYDRRGQFWTIDLVSALPAISQSITIDGTSQPDYSTTPVIELDGASAGSGSNGLVVEANDTTVEGLDIGQFGQDGIDVTGNNDVIAGNFIGTTPAGTAALGNGRQGVLVNGSNNTIGGAAAGAGNVLSGNGNDGLQIAGSGATGNVALGNLIGIGPAGAGAIPNGRFGVLVNFQASHNLVGTNGDGVSDAAERNFISGNTSWGIEISDPGTANNVVAGDFIGTAGHGAAAVPNGDGGVLIQNGATANLIGTDGVSIANADEANVISGNNGAAGIMISDSGTRANVVAGNLIGTTTSGTAANGNAGDGVLIQAGAQSNVIGTNGDGNGDAAEQNVISGNTDQGVYIGGTGTNDNVVAGNLIGVDITGANALANGAHGVWIEGGAQSNRIGVNAGDPGAAAEPNVISGNDASGVGIADTGTSFNSVAGNWIGNNPADSFTVSNGGDGVSILRGTAQSNTIGGSVALANSIVNNIGNGVAVYGNATTGNAIRFNMIRKNQSLGIDLGGDGVTPNHGDTAATGPNNLENYPIITSAGSGTTTMVGVSFASLPSASYTIDFYESAVADPSGYGEGNLWLGSVSVTTDANGQVDSPSTFNVPANTHPGQFITATATDAAGDTSEFSNAWQLTAISSQVTVTSSPGSPTYGQSLTFSAIVAPIGPDLATPTGTVQFQVDGSAFGSAVTLADGVATSVSTNTLPAGVHTISAVYSGDSTYTTDTGTTSQTVTPAPVTITADDKSKIYGAADPALTYTVSGLMNAEDPSIITGVTLATTTGAVATAGTHPITTSGGTAANYAITDVSGTLTVSKAPLTVAADNKTKVYGDADPALTYTPSGTLYYGDAFSVITGVTLATTTGASATAGTHAITTSGGTAANYAITDVNGVLTVTPLPLVTVTSVRIETVRLKKKRSATDIVVTFSGAVDTLDAVNLGNYSLAAPAKGKKSKTYNKRIKITSAVNGPTARQVTLQSNGKLSLSPSPQLRITASGIFDSMGRPLDGNGDGKPGDDYVALLTKGGAQPQIMRVARA